MVSEYGTLCLDYRPVASLASINRDKGEEGERVRRTTFSLPL